MDAAQQFLRDRVCDATDRIPQPAFPFFSETVEIIIPQGATGAQLVLDAQRDLLLSDLSMFAADADDDVQVAASIDIEYCDTVLARHVNLNTYDYCCSRKPLFVLGIKENKKLRIDVTLAAAAPAGGARVNATFSGMQGNGCCP